MNFCRQNLTNPDLCSCSSRWSPLNWRTNGARSHCYWRTMPWLYHDIATVTGALRSGCIMTSPCYWRTTPWLYHDAVLLLAHYAVVCIMTQPLLLEPLLEQQRQAFSQLRFELAEIFSDSQSRPVTEFLCGRLWFYRMTAGSRSILSQTSSVNLSRQSYME